MSGEAWRQRSFRVLLEQRWENTEVEVPPLGQTVSSWSILFIHHQNVSALPHSKTSGHKPASQVQPPFSPSHSPTLTLPIEDTSGWRCYLMQHYRSFQYLPVTDLCVFVYGKRLKLSLLFQKRRGVLKAQDSLSAAFTVYIRTPCCSL